MFRSNPNDKIMIFSKMDVNKILIFDFPFFRWHCDTLQDPLTCLSQDARSSFLRNPFADCERDSARDWRNERSELAKRRQSAKSPLIWRFSVVCFCFLRPRRFTCFFLNKSRKIVEKIDQISGVGKRDGVLDRLLALDARAPQRATKSALSFVD